jgi:CO/xanthine dehydrogenase FAD-binding subunit
MTEAYLYPGTIEEAVGILAKQAGCARIIAGGTDLMLEMHKGRQAPACLVDITRISGLDRIEVGGDWVTVGAAVTFGMLQEHPFLRDHVPALVEAARSVGARPIQMMATWAGNIAQAMPAADGGIVAVALRAEACVVDQNGARWAQVESLYRSAKTSALDSTRQMISYLRFPAPGSGWGCAWVRAGRRPSLTLPILNCAATVQLAPDGKVLAAATLALGPVAALPFRARKAEAFLTGQPLAAETWLQAAEIAQSECHPRSNPLRASREYREALIPVMVQAAFKQAVERAKCRRAQAT